MSKPRFVLKPVPEGYLYFEILPKSVKNSKFVYLDPSGSQCLNIDPLQLDTLAKMLGGAIDEAIKRAGSSLVPEVTFEMESFPEGDQYTGVVYTRCWAISPNVPAGGTPPTRVDLGAAPAAHHAFRFDFSHQYQSELIGPWADTLRNSPLL